MRTLEDVSFSIMAAEEIHWGGLKIDWDGEDGFTLRVPHAMVEWPTQWLERHLPERLDGLLGDVRVDVTQAFWSESGASRGVDTWGHISIGPLALPLQDARVGAVDELRRIVEEAADAADAAARQAFERADELSKSLRRA